MPVHMWLDSNRLRAPNSPELHSPVWVGQWRSAPQKRVHIWVCLFLYGRYWLALSGRNSWKIPEIPQIRSQSFACNSLQEYGWGNPQAHFKAFEAFRVFPEFSRPQYGWGCLFFRKWFRRGPLRAVVMEFSAVLRAFLSIYPWRDATNLGVFDLCHFDLSFGPPRLHLKFKTI